MVMIVGLVIAGVSSAAQAQAVDTSGVQDMSVDDLVQTLEKWKFAVLGVSMILVVALLFAGGLLKPGGFKEAGLRDLEALPGIVLIFGAFVVLLAQSSAGTVLGKIPWVEAQEFKPSQTSVIVVCTGMLFGVIAGIGMLFVLRKAAPDAGLKLSPLDMPVGFGCFVLAFPFIQLMSELGLWLHIQLAGAAPEPVAHPTLQKLVNDPGDPWVIALVAAAILGAPVIEEIVYRVFVQGAFLKWLKSPWISILLTSIIFALLHRVGNTVPWHALPTLAALGVACGVAYERTKRVGVPIAIHMGFNAMNVLIVLIMGANAAESGV